MDDSGRDVTVAQIELLLNYANRFYKRQFKTREAARHNLPEQLEAFLEGHFGNDEPSSGGVPSVQYLWEKLNVSPTYLSDMLRALTGQNAQQHIHQKLIAKAKKKLSITELSVSEIAYGLGFEHTRSFSKLFKAKISLSPIEFRQSFK